MGCPSGGGAEALHRGGFLIVQVKDLFHMGHLEGLQDTRLGPRELALPARRFERSVRADHGAYSGAIYKWNMQKVNNNLLLPCFQQVLKLIAKSADWGSKNQIAFEIKNRDVALSSYVDIHCHLARSGTVVITRAPSAPAQTT